jgi:hypothetical protein
MSVSFEFYEARADEAAHEAETATLMNVKERHLRAEKTWRGLAEHALRVKRDREETQRLKLARRSEQTTEEIG